MKIFNLQISEKEKGWALRTILILAVLLVLFNISDDLDFWYKRCIENPIWLNDLSADRCNGYNYNINGGGATTFFSLFIISIICWNFWDKKSKK